MGRGRDIAKHPTTYRTAPRHIENDPNPEADQTESKRLGSYSGDHHGIGGLRVTGGLLFSLWPQEFREDFNRGGIHS